MSDDDKARAAYDKALTLKENGQYADAISVLTLMRVRTFNPMYVQCFDLLADLCFCHDSGAHADKIVDALRAVKNKLRGTQHLEDGTSQIVNIVLKKVRVMCVNAQAMTKAMIEKPADSDIALAALSGVPITVRAKDRFIAPCERGVARLAAAMFDGNTIGLSRKVLPVFTATAVSFFAVCKEFALREALEKAARSISWTLRRVLVDPISSPNAEASQFKINQLKETENDRKDFYNSEEAGEETVQMLCTLASQLTEAGEWRQLWTVMSCLKTISDQLLESRGFKEQYVQSCVTIGDVFWSCANYNYHALSLSLAARMATSGKKELSTRALLAALCAQDSAQERNAFMNKHDDSSVAEIADLFDGADASRTSILARLRLQGTTEAADAQVYQFSQTLASDSAVDFGALHKQVSAITKSNVLFEQYETQLHHTVLRHQLEQLSRKNDRINVGDLFVSSANLSDSEYVRVLEPIILSDNGVPVEVDCKAKIVTFRNSTKSKVLRAFTKLSSKVDRRPAIALVPSRVVCSSTSGGACPIKFENLEAAHRRIIELHKLQTACAGTVQTRVKDKEAEEKKQRAKKLDQRREQETEKREKAQQVQMKKLYSQYYERQRQERNKALLAKLRTKYPGFKVDNAIATKSTSVFENELSVALAAFKRRGAEGDRRDVLKGNLYERALRRLEIPKRREVDAKNADKHRADRAAARANTIAQHRREFDKRQLEKMELQKFLKAAGDFEEEWRRLGSKEKASKRDAQQSLLQQEMERLAAAMN